MFVYSKSQAEKIYHRDTCLYANRIKQSNKGYFYTRQEAIEKGYRACNHCSNMGRLLQKNQKEIARFSKDKAMTLSLYNNQLFVKSREGAWKIAFNMAQEKLLLFHENVTSYHYYMDQQELHTKKYHLQPNITAKSILEYLEYINHHDTWRSQHEKSYRDLPQSTKKQKKIYKREKKRYRKLCLARVYSLLETIQGC